MATTIQDLEERVDALYNSVVQMQQNLNPVTDKADNAYNTANALTPTVLSKKVSIGDTEVTFNNVPNGNITVFVEDENGNYPNCTMERNSNIITVYFEPSEYVTTVTLSIV